MNSRKSGQLSNTHVRNEQVHVELVGASSLEATHTSHSTAFISRGKLQCVWPPCKSSVRVRRLHHHHNSLFFCLLSPAILYERPTPCLTDWRKSIVVDWPNTYFLDQALAKAASFVLAILSCFYIFSNCMWCWDSAVNWLTSYSVNQHLHNIEAQYYNPFCDLRLSNFRPVQEKHDQPCHHSSNI